MKQILIAVDQLANAVIGGWADETVSLERVHQTVQSWCEHASHANTYRLRTQLLQKFACCRPSAANHIQARHTQEIAP